MTTQRLTPESDDENVLGQVQLYVLFHPLSGDQRAKIWHRSLKELVYNYQDHISENKIDTWSRLDLNAQQIVNSIMVAVGLANALQRHMKERDIEAALSTIQDYMEYKERLGGKRPGQAERKIPGE